MKKSAHRLCDGACAMCWRQPLSRRQDVDHRAEVRTASSERCSSVRNGRTLYLFHCRQGHEERVLRTVRDLLAAAHRRQADRRRRPERVAARHDEAQGREAAGHYNGHPLYFFQPDKKAGDINGQGYSLRRKLVDRLGCGAKITTKP